MGHANLCNISDFFVNRLYAKGQLCIADGVTALVRAREKVHASEGDYEDDGMLGMALQQVVHYLTRRDPTRHGYSGPPSGGPWIEPVLTAWLGGRRAVTRLTRAMLDEIEAGNNDRTTVQAAADRLAEEGHEAWAAAVRLLPRRREVVAQWETDRDSEWDWDERDPDSAGQVFDRVPFRFAAGWRKRYREVPRLSNVTN